MRFTGCINNRAFTYYSRLGKVKKYVETNYHQRITLGKAAGIAALEEKYFSAFFHDKVGIGFKHWLTQFRINKAIELMRTRNYTITGISLAVGFQDIRTFERSFKRCTGLTPIAFKKSVRPC